MSKYKVRWKPCPDTVRADLPDDCEDDRRVHVDEKTRDLVERVKDQRVSPCNDRAGQRACSVRSPSMRESQDQLTESKQVAADEEEGGAWKHPDPEQVEHIDKVAHTVIISCAHDEGQDRRGSLEEEVVELLALVYPGSRRQVESRLSSVCEWQPFWGHAV